MFEGAVMAVLERASDVDAPGEQRERGRVQAQALVREVNEQIHRLRGIWADGERTIICECCNGECLQPLQIALADYEAVRRFPTRFVVKRGHQTSGSDRVVEERGGYVVVEKDGPGGVTAVQLDPRGREAAA
jgi:hypothetical protein